MRHFILLFFGLIFCWLACSGQSGSIGLRVGYGIYTMPDLKALQNTRKELTGLPVKTTDNYPGTPYYRVELARYSPHFISKWSLFYIFNSTGARSTLSDYSGRIDLDAIINGNQLGITLEHKLFTSEKWKFGAYTDLDFIWSTLKLKDYISILSPTNFSSIEKSRYKSYGFCTEPGLFVQYYILKHLHVQTNLGLMIDFSGDFHLEGHKQMKLAYKNNLVRPQWTGLRLGFQVDL